MMAVTDMFKRAAASMSEEEQLKKISLTQKYLESQRQGNIPSALYKSILTNFVLAALLVVLCTGAALFLRQPTYLVGFIFSAYLCYVGTMTITDYRSGAIKERVLICSAVNRKLSGNQLIMQDVSVEPVRLYEFYFPRKGCPFYPDNVYIIYTNENQPHRIVAWLGV